MLENVKVIAKANKGVMQKFLTSSKKYMLKLLIKDAACVITYFIVANMLTLFKGPYSIDVIEGLQDAKFVKKMLIEIT